MGLVVWLCWAPPRIENLWSIYPLETLYEYHGLWTMEYGWYGVLEYFIPLILRCIQVVGCFWSHISNRYELNSKIRILYVELSSTVKGQNTKDDLSIRLVMREGRELKLYGNILLLRVSLCYMSWWELVNLKISFIFSNFWKKPNWIPKFDIPQLSKRFQIMFFSFLNWSLYQRELLGYYCFDVELSPSCFTLTRSSFYITIWVW